MYPAVDICRLLTCKFNKNNDVDENKELTTKKQAAVVGLTNLGNSCFFNSILQCLIHTDELRNFFLSKYDPSIVNKSDNECQLSAAMADFMHKVRKNYYGNDNIITPSRVYGAVKQNNPRLMSGFQQDSYRCLAYLLTTMHDELNESKTNQIASYHECDTDGVALNEKNAVENFWNDHIASNISIVSELFHALYRQKTSCKVCGTSWKDFDVYSYLSLPLMEHDAHEEKKRLTKQAKQEKGAKGSEESKDSKDRWSLPSCFKKTQNKIAKNVYECIDLYTSLVDLDPCYCDKCQSEQPMTKQVHLWTFPKILIIHLKRFRLASYGTTKVKKITDSIDFPVKLNLQNYVVNGDIQKPKMYYDLFAVNCHDGGCYGGHYRAYCLNQSDQTWREYNDSLVSEPMDSKKVLKRSSSAILLFYRQRLS